MKPAAFLLACALGASTVHAADLPSAVPPEMRRGVEQTFLTYPEWFLVHSPNEYADMVATRPSHEFPFARHVGQLWTSYAAVTREQRRRDYPANPGYHVMIMVIAGSTTAEYAVRWGYENTVGRISWATASGLTPEDRYAAATARDYVDFIRREPWYLYDFRSRLAGLWRDVPATGPDMIRKWERRFALTCEYVVKAVYGKLIEWATRAVYEPALLSTQVVVEGVAGDLPPVDGVRLLRRLDGDRALLELPRYDAFAPAAARLADAGVRLVDVAGNTSVILVTVLVDGASRLEAGTHAGAGAAHGSVLFEQPILTVPGKKRVALVLPLPELSGFLVAAPANGVVVEHVYDY